MAKSNFFRLPSRRELARSIITVFVTAVAVQLSLPFIGGVYYSLCGSHDTEQAWLDRATLHLQRMRDATDDPDLQGILDYTLQRYSRIGAWNVMVMPLTTPLTHPGCKVIGCNCPWCPGLTLDTCLLLWPSDEVAIVLAHEAMHDYRPFFGHGHINDREQKLYELSHAVRRLHRSDLRRLP
jgi:hypothetical protein